MKKLISILVMAVALDASAALPPILRNAASTNAFPHTTNTIFVGKNGSDTRGNGMYHAPYLTIGKAKTNAVAGKTIRVGPGTYNENDLLKAGVNYYGEPGADILFQQATTNSSLRGIFDDRFIGATTNTIVWHGKVAFIGFTNWASIDESEWVADWPWRAYTEGVFIYTNAATLFDVTVGTVQFQNYSAPFNYSAAVVIVGCNSNSVFKADVVERVGDLNLDDGANPHIATSSGVVWDAVTCKVKIGRLLFSALGDCYALYGQEHVGGIGSNVCDFQYEGDFVEGRNYNLVYSPEYRNWYKITFQTSGGLGPIGIYAGGKHYFWGFEKLEMTAGNNSIEIYPATGFVPPKVWISGQKNTLAAAGSKGVWNAGGVLDMNFQEYDYTSGALGFAAMPQAGFFPTNFINGGRLTMTNGLPVLHTAGAIQLRDITLHTSSTNGIVISTNGLILKGVTIKAPVGRAAITNSTVNTNTVGIYWSAATETNSWKVNVSPSAGFTVDAAVR